MLFFVEATEAPKTKEWRFQRHLLLHHGPCKGSLYPAGTTAVAPNPGSSGESQVPKKSTDARVPPLEILIQEEL